MEYEDLALDERAVTLVRLSGVEVVREFWNRRDGAEIEVNECDLWGAALAIDPYRDNWLYSENRNFHLAELKHDIEDVLIYTYVY